MELRLKGQSDKAIISGKALAVLGQGIQMCLSQWTALQLAVHNEWGGPASKLKAQQLHSEIMTLFTSAKGTCDIDELEDLLDNYMVELFNCELEDGSLEEVAEKIIVMHEDCLLGNFDGIRQMSAAATSGSKQSISSFVQHQIEDAEASKSSGEKGFDTATPSEGHMEVEEEPTSVNLRSQVTNTKLAQLTEKDVADGWQVAPSRRRKPGMT